VKFVFNQKGFLLLEHLIAIAIMGIISVAFLSVMQVISGYTVNQNALTMHEVNTIAIRLQNEVRFAESFSANSGRLDVYWHDSDDIVNIFVLNDRLVRRVNGVGGEVLIYNIASMEVVALSSNVVRVVLRCMNGNDFSFILSTLQLKVEFVTEVIPDEIIE